MPVINKLDLKEPALVRPAEIAKAIGHPARIAILKILAEKNTCICGDISDQLPLAQSTVSQHLKALKKSGLITGEVEGVKTCYCLNPDGVKELKHFLTNLSDELNEAEICC